MVGAGGVSMDQRDGGEVQHRNRRVQGILERSHVGVRERQREHEHHGEGLERGEAAAAGGVDPGELREVSRDRGAAERARDPPGRERGDVRAAGAG